VRLRGYDTLGTQMNTQGFAVAVPAGASAAALGASGAPGGALCMSPSTEPIPPPDGRQGSATIGPDREWRISAAAQAPHWAVAQGLLLADALHDTRALPQPLEAILQGQVSWFVADGQAATDHRGVSQASLPPVAEGVIDPEAELISREAARRDPIEAMVREARPRFDAILAIARRTAR